MSDKKKDGYGDSPSKPAYPCINLDLKIYLNPSKVSFILTEDQNGWIEEEDAFVVDGWTYLCLSDKEKYMYDGYCFCPELPKWRLVKDNWSFQGDDIMCDGEKIGNVLWWNHSKNVKELDGWHWILGSSGRNLDELGEGQYEKP